jgi:hypothetical protein
MNVHYIFWCGQVIDECIEGPTTTESYNRDVPK